MDSRNLERKIAHLMTSEKFWDVLVVVGFGPSRRHFKVHRLILSLYSQVFENIFYGKPEKLVKDIMLPNVDPDSCEALIRYIYTGEVSLTSTRKATEIYHLADRYSVLELKQVCVDYLSESISPNLAISIYEMATVAKEDELRLKCWKYIVHCARQVLEANSFREAKVSTIMSIMDQKFLNIESEAELYNAIVIWGRLECLKSKLPVSDLNVRQKIQEFLRGIKFLSMDSESFALGPATGNILTPEEKTVILQNMAAPGLVKFLDNFNPGRDKRNQHSPGRLLSTRSPSGLRDPSQLHLFDKPCFKGRVKFWRDDVFIYGVRAYLSKSKHESVLPNVKCDLCIRNLSRDCKVETKNLTLHPEKEDFVIEISDPLYVARGEICQIELSVQYTSECLYYCTSDCKLPCTVMEGDYGDESDDTSMCGFHLHGILMWHILDARSFDNND